MVGNSNGRGISDRAQSRLKAGLLSLLEAFRYSQDIGGDRWEFAVEIQELRKMGLNDIDLRWYVRKGYVQHAREVTVAGDNGRAFRPTGDLTFCQGTCFVLTDTGVAKAVEPETATRDDAMDHPLERANGRTLRGQPIWDADCRELRLDNTIVKRFKWHAVNQEIVLSAFQEEGWPVRIDDPLPPHPEQDSKCRLSDTIKCLNRKQLNELIHFRGDGTGEGVIWEHVLPKQQ